MKLLITLICLVLPLCNAVYAQTTSVQQFSSIVNPLDRQKVIEQAPVEQRQDLQKINHHLILLASWGGEAGLKDRRETLVAAARGFDALVALAPIQAQVWERYIGGVLEADINTGMSSKQVDIARDALEKEQDGVLKRAGAIHNLVFNLAFTPRALELNRQASELLSSAQKWMYDPNARKALTQPERTVFDKKLDDIVRELESLPKLTPEQAQREYDALPEEKIKIIGSFK